MKLKIDENLPAECAEILVAGGWEADTVADEGMTGVDDSALAVAFQSEGRILVTLDLDFANIRAYPAGSVCRHRGSPAQESGETFCPRSDAPIRVSPRQSITCG